MESQLNVTSYGDVAASVLFVLQVFLCITWWRSWIPIGLRSKSSFGGDGADQKHGRRRGRLNPSDIKSRIIKIESQTSNRAEKNNFLVDKWR